MRATILIWSAVSGLVIGILAGIFVFASIVLAGEMLPGVVPRLGPRSRLVLAIVAFGVLPLAGATLGWLEGRLKLR